MPDDDAANLRRAGAIHDVGMVGVTSAVWDATEPWTLAQQERARTHPYLTGRMFARVPPLAPIVACASQHHERLDGSGYPHGLTGSALSMPARGCWPPPTSTTRCASRVRTDRPSTPTRRSATMREEVRDGRLDGDAVEAVLTAAGHRVAPPSRAPGGPDPPRGRRARAAGARVAPTRRSPTELTISRKTVSSHLEHIYTKLGVTTRTEAALFAMQQRAGRAARRLTDDRPRRSAERKIR